VWWYRAAISLAWWFFVGVTASMLASASNPADLWVVVPGSAMLFAAVRSFRSARIDLRDDGVAIYRQLRTRQLAWSRVRAVGVTEGTSAVFLPWRVPYFELDNGTTVLADDIRSLKQPSIV